MLFDLAKHPYTRCLDGSPAGYYISHGSNDLVVINLQGGGECVDKAGCQVRPQGPWEKGLGVTVSSTSSTVSLFEY